MVSFSAIVHPRVWPVWDLLFPPLCSICGKDLDSSSVFFCNQCWADAPIPEAKHFPPLKNVDAMWCGYSFAPGNIVRESVHSLKYDGHRLLAHEMAKRLLPRITVRCVETNLVWAPVPQHWRRRMIRGFNQSDALANALSDATGHKPPIHLIKRVRYTPTQTANSFAARHDNVKGAFGMCGRFGIPDAVLLIDDVITTGATVDECACVMKKAGVKWVGALSFALTRR